MDKLNIVVYRYRNNTYVKDTEVDLRLTEYEKLYLSDYIYWVTVTFSLSIALYWMEQLFIFKTNSVKIGCFFPHEHFPNVPDK